MKKPSFLAYLFVAILACPTAQSQGPVTGSYPFAPLDSYGFESINRGNLDVHFSIPIFSKPGRGGTNFNYSLNYDGLVWSPATSSGTATWTPAPSWGWTDSANSPYGYISRQFTLTSCTYYLDDGKFKGVGFIERNYNYAYHDIHGVSHPFNFSYSNVCGQAATTPTGTGSYTIADNSGITIYRDGGDFYAISSSGQAYSLTTDGSGYTDTNGNQLSVLPGGAFIDTMGKNVLTLTGSGTPASPQIFTYTDSNGTPQTVTVNYTSYNVATAFGVSGIGEYSQSNTSLVRSIVYSADNSSYGFTYESTPDAPGSVTGRLASVTLRTGGAINYVYTGGFNGIETDGTYSGLTRTTNATADGDPATSFAYTRSGMSTTASQTSRTDVNGNVDTSSYLVTNGYFYEGDHAFYSGPASGTAVQETITCFNTFDLPPCASSSAANGFEYMAQWVYANGVAQSTSTTTFSVAGSGVKTRTVVGYQTTAYTYETLTGSYGLPYSRLQEMYLTSSGTSATKYTYNYDETVPIATSGLPNHVEVTLSRGNLTSSHVWIDSSHHLDQTSTFDDAGQLLSQTDWNNNLTTFQYDTATDTLLTQTNYPLGLTTKSVFDPNTGLLTQSQDANGNPTLYTYDGLERPLTITYPSSTQFPNGGFVQYSYPDAQTSAVSTRHEGSATNTVTAVVDAYGRTMTTTQSDSANGDVVVTSHYDDDGRLYSVSNPARPSNPNPSTDGTTYYTYDAAGRKTNVLESDNSQKQYGYSGGTVTVTDEAGKQKQIDSEAGQILRVGEPDSTGAFSLLTTYSSTGQLETVEQAGGAGTASYRNRGFSYDLAGRLTSEKTPEQGTTTYTYVNASGALCSGSLNLPCTRTDAIGTVTTYTYDALNRLTGKTYSDGTAPVTITYDQTAVGGTPITNGKGQRTSMTDASGTSSWSYDLMGRVVSDSRTIHGVMKSASYTYNSDGTPASMTDYAGNTVTYGYNAAGQLASVTDAGTNVPYISGASYAPAGLLVSATLGNGATLSNSFNARLQPASITASMTGTPVFGLGFSYGAASHNNGTISGLTNQLDATRSQSFGYDQLNRLISAQAGTIWGYTYTYDNWGNLYQMTPTPGVSNSETALDVAAPGVNNQLPGYSYDADGRMTSDGVNTYTYDAEGRILTAGGQTYTYNGDGVRVLKGSTLYWPDESGKSSNETDLSGSTVVRNIYVGSTQLAREDGSGNWSYFLQDHLGSNRMVLDDSGSVVNDVDYYPFGGVAYQAGSTTNKYGFTGYEADSSTNYAVYRNQSPSLGRFIRPDPYDGSYKLTDPQSLNRYSYVNNKPIVFTDPMGLYLYKDCQATWDEGGDSTLSESCVDVDIETASSSVTETIGYGAASALAPNNSVPTSTISSTACTAAATAAGAAGGALLGGAAGGVVGGAAGGAGGTLVAPGVGTVGGGIVGAEGGATAGAWAGGILGGLVGNVVGNIMCSSGTGGGSGTPPDRCTQVRQQAISTCSEQFVGRGHGSDAPGLVRQCVRQIMQSAGCSY